MVFNATFSNISAISWRSVLLVEESGVPGENHRPTTSHWQIYLECIASINIKLNWDTTQRHKNKQKHQSSLQLFSGVYVARSLVFCVMFYSSLFVLLSFLFWPLYCLSFFNLQVMITSLWYLQTFLLNLRYITSICKHQGLFWLFAV
jgi:hypothetical protein